jgi:hypothetical protein
MLLGKTSFSGGRESKKSTYRPGPRPHLSARINQMQKAFEAWRQAYLPLLRIHAQFFR